jgi:hypothetical protein
MGALQSGKKFVTLKNGRTRLPRSKQERGQIVEVRSVWRRLVLAMEIRVVCGSMHCVA